MRKHGDPWIAGVSGFTAGQNASVEPASLSDLQYWRGLNISCRGSIPKTRPPFIRLLQLPTGKFSGCFRYARTAKDRIIFGIGDRVNALPMDTLTTTSFGVFGGGSMPYTPFWFAKIERYLVVQNGIDAPLIIEGTTPVDQSAIPIYQRFPIGRSMAYGQARAFVVVNQVYDQTTNALIPDLGYVQFRASPPFRAQDPDYFLTFNEEQYYAGGGAIGMPQESGEINKLEFLRNAPTGTGYGQLMALAQAGVSGFDMTVPRTSWGDTQIGKCLFYNAGMNAPLSVVAVNDDMLYRSFDGMRSVRYTASATAAGSGLLSNPTLSPEVNYLLSKDSRQAQMMTSATVLNDRVLMLTGSYLENGEVFFRNLVSYDASVVAGTNMTPVTGWDGAWSGPNMKMMGICTALWNGIERVFIVVRENGQNWLWYLDDTDTGIYDDSLNGVNRQPLCRMMYKAIDFGASNAMKHMGNMTVWISKLKGQGSITCYWRPDGYPYWLKGQTSNLNGPVDGSEAQDRPGLRLGPLDRQYFEPGRDRDLRNGCVFQFALEWRGRLQVDRVEIKLDDLPTSFELKQDAEGDVVPLVEGTDGYKLDDSDYIS